MNRPLAHAERIAWAQLARTPHIGPITFAALIRRYRTPDAALEALPDLARGRFRPPPVSAIEAELEALDGLGAQLICACEPAYPALLAALDPGPAMIAARGDASLLQRPSVAIVGARDASAVGLKLAADFAAGLGDAGFVVVSGLARGIDAKAHAAALATGTVAVMAGGLDRPYPPQNLDLHGAICAQGLVIAEAPLGMQARARDFPRRNHLISGLSLGVVVIEAAVRSGSLITAHAAADQGRDVFAVPGSPLDARFRGANALIKGGATMVEGPEDVCAALAFATPRIARQDPPSAKDADTAPAEAHLVGRISALLSPTPVHINDLARLSGAPMAAVSAAVVELELSGRAASLPGGYVAFGSAAFGGA